MKGLTGSAGGDSGQDIFAAALKSDIDPAQTENDAQQVLYDIGGQFDSGEFDRLGPSAFSSMRLVALAWARMGWAKFQRGENLAAMQFLTVGVAVEPVGDGRQSSWVRCSKSKDSRRRRATCMRWPWLRAGSDVADSRARLAKAGGDAAAAEKEIAQAPAELVQARTVKLGLNHEQDRLRRGSIWCSTVRRVRSARSLWMATRAFVRRRANAGEGFPGEISGCFVGEDRAAREW